MRLPIIVIKNILSRTVSELLQIICQIFTFDRADTFVHGEPLNSGRRNLASRN